MLGQLEVFDGVQWCTVGAPKSRLLLSILLINADQVVSLDQLAYELWGDAPPRTVANQVHGYVSRLRHVLSDHDSRALVTHSPGYRLVAEPDDIDAKLFSRLAAGATAPANAQQLAQALALWRGPALADVPATQTIRAEVSRLEHERLIAIEGRIEADLACGRHAQLLTELETLITEHPLREILWQHYILALYRSGLQAQALAAFQRVRLILDDELGISPGTGLRKLHQQILAGGAGLNLRAHTTGTDARVVPRQLPPDIANFIGRTRQLEQLNTFGHHDPVVITGCPGVGKTTLAIYWAHRVAHRFPDGQLYLNLRGFDPGERIISSTEAIRVFLEALQGATPAGLQAQAALYRSLLAGKRMLIVLDNARDADHVRPLLPGSDSCFVLITSRDQMQGLLASDGARPVSVDMLTDDESRDFLAVRLGAQRVATQPEAAEAIVAGCAGLPLALAIVAARGATHATFPLADLASGLRDGLAAFDNGDMATDVRAVFSTSLQTLTPPSAKLFRSLALHPGPDLSATAAASLAGIPLPQARTLLGELCRAHLLEQHQPGRYELHDLLRVYAQEISARQDTAAQRQEAMTRCLDHYLHTGFKACRLLAPRRDPIPLPALHDGVSISDLSDHHQAMAWFAAEHPAIRRLIDEANPSHAWQLAWTLLTFLDRRGYRNEWVASQRTALAVAQATNDPLGHAQTSRDLGRALSFAGHIDEAHLHLRRALRLFGDLNDHAAMGHINHDLADAAHLVGDNHQAVELAEQGLHHFELANHQSGLANSLNSLGWYQAMLGNAKQTISYCTRALVILRELKDKRRRSLHIGQPGLRLPRPGRNPPGPRLLPAGRRSVRRSRRPPRAQRSAQPSRRLPPGHG